MITALLTAIMLLTPAADTPDVTETVAVKYWSVVQVEDMLLHNGGARSRGRTGAGLGEPKSLIPAGIRAWSVDEERNQLTFIGDEAGITAVKNLIRLLDVRPRQISVHVRFLRMDAAPDPEGAPFQIVEEAETGAFKPDEVGRGWTMQVANNHPVRFRGLGLASVPADTLQEITPRVNGDGTLTVQLNAAAAASPEADPEAVILIRRVRSGHPLAVAFPRQGKVMWVWATLLPDEPASTPKK